MQGPEFVFFGVFDGLYHGKSPLNHHFQSIWSKSKTCPWSVIVHQPIARWELDLAKVFTSAKVLLPAWLMQISTLATRFGHFLWNVLFETLDFRDAPWDFRFLDGFERSYFFETIHFRIAIRSIFTRIPSLKRTAKVFENRPIIAPKRKLDRFPLPPFFSWVNLHGSNHSPSLRIVS